MLFFQLMSRRYEHASTVMTSNKSFEDAIQQGVERATRTLRNVRSAWVKEQRISIQNDKIAEYQVNIQITFVLEE